MKYRVLIIEKYEIPEIEINNKKEAIKEVRKKWNNTTNKEAFYIKTAFKLKKKQPI